MSDSRKLARSLVVIGALMVGSALDVQAAEAPTGGASSASLVDRGKYIALAADCASCHTAPGGHPFAGGDPLKSPLGTLYGPNITQDKATGIGSWTKADFERALRRGISKDGSYIYPAMPYDAYTKMSAADMDALWAYMKSLPAVSHKVPSDTLPFPFNIRSGMAVWQAAYFKPGLFQPEAAKGAEWNRGAYLVDALGHCTDCHSPRNIAQATEKQHRLGGGVIEGWYAPDISNDAMSKLNDWKVDELAHYLKTGKAPGNVKVFGPMAEVVHESLGHLTDADLHAMAVYLKDQPTGGTVVTATKVKWPEDRLTAGRQLYAENCSGCHQNNGKGIKGAAPALAANDAVAAAEPYDVIMAMLDGFAPQGSWGAMGSFASLSDDQITDIANYVRTAWGNGAEPNSTPWMVENWRKNEEAAKGSANALLCPSLPLDVMKPALSEGSVALKQAAANDAGMQKAVGDYLTARPKSSTAEVIEALSTAYCRSIAEDHLSQSRMSVKIADFAQHVAVAAHDRGTST